MTQNQNYENNIDRTAMNFYFLSNDREIGIWQDCIFVFDSSALLGLYFFSKKSQEEIFKKTLEKVKGRLWISSHIQYEYFKNREGTLKKPIDEKYKSLEDNQIKNLEKKIKEINNTFKEFRQQTQKDETHPYINGEICEEFETSINQLNDGLRIFSKKVKDEFTTRISEIESFVEKDTVLEGIEQYFKVGREYSYNEITEIVKEGEQRYQNEVPPGYKDFKDKEGIQKFGDLIIWKQIIEFATKKKLPIVLVTNDIKSDWCYKDQKRSKESRVGRPREDLIREMKDIAKVPFWMYTLPQFLYKAKQILNTGMNDEVIEEAEVATQSLLKKVRFDGLYRSKFNDYQKYLRFYEDGRVIGVSCSGVPNSSWFNKDYNENGIYKIEGNEIEFSLISPSGRVDYKGTIDEGEILLKVHSRINGYKGSESFSYMED